jgi:DNA-binding XRE family transcriptional regulator
MENPIKEYRKGQGKSERTASREARITRRAFHTAETSAVLTLWPTITAIAAWMNTDPRQLEQQLAEWRANKETA